MIRPSVSCNAMPTLNCGGVAGEFHFCAAAKLQQTSNKLNHIPKLRSVPRFVCDSICTCVCVIRILLISTVTLDSIAEDSISEIRSATTREKTPFANSLLPPRPLGCKPALLIRGVCVMARRDSCPSVSRLIGILRGEPHRRMTRERQIGRGRRVVTPTAALTAGAGLLVERRAREEAVIDG